MEFVKLLTFGIVPVLFKFNVLQAACEMFT
jgi:hypothetical protein